MPQLTFFATSRHFANETKLSTYIMQAMIRVLPDGEDSAIPTPAATRTAFNESVPSANKAWLIEPTFRRTRALPTILRVSFAVFYSELRAVIETGDII